MLDLINLGTEHALELVGKSQYLDSAHCLATDIKGLTDCPNFKKHAEDSFNFGFVDHPYWFKTEFNYSGEHPYLVYAEIGYALLDDIQVWLVDRDTGEALQYFQSGDRLRFDQRPITYPTFVFPLDIQPNTSYTLYTKVTTTSSMQVPITLWSPDAFISEKQLNIFIQGGLIGIISIMIIYNLALFVTVRDRSYIFFALCLLGYLGAEAVLTGMAYAYFWPTSPVWNNFSLVFVSNLSLFGLAQFSRFFLQTDSSARSYSQGLNILSALSIILMLLSPFFPYQIMIKLTAINVFLIPTMSYILGMLQWQKHFASARFFVIAFSAFVIATAIFVLNKFGIISRNLFTEFAVHFGAVATIGLLSIALADRVNRERKDKEVAQLESIDALDRFRALFENSLDGMFRANISGALLSVNPSFARMINGERASRRILTRMNIHSFFPRSERNFSHVIQELEKNSLIMHFELEGQRLSGEKFWSSLSARLFTDYKTQDVFIEGSLVDITERKQSEQQLKHLASHDSLTGLLNRGAFERRLQSALDDAKQNKEQHSLLFIDLDRFKIVNDTCGHAAGDELLKQLALMFNKHVRKHDSLARFGGDEFALFLAHCDLRQATDIAQRLKNDINGYKFIWDGKSFSVGCSIGIVPINSLSGSIKEILGLADQACYTAKDEGRNRIIVQDEHETVLNKRLSEALMVSSISESIENNHFELYFQPIVPLQKNATGHCYEILLRLRKDGLLLSPGSFMPAAERYNIMASIDRWVIRTYFNWLSKNRNAMKQLEMVSINLSAQTLAEADLLDELKMLLTTYGIPAQKICFEITESVALSGLNDTIKFINTLKEFGVRFALDDFGSGYSTYSYLTQLPVDFVKIDGSFVKSILLNPVNMAIVKSIVDVAHVMHLGVIAEFVETSSVEGTLIELGVDFAQGYYLGKPLPLEHLLDQDHIAESSI